MQPLATVADASMLVCPCTAAQSTRSKDALRAVSRVYSGVNLRKPKEYYDDTLEIDWGLLEPFEVTRQLGKGKCWGSADIEGGPEPVRLQLSRDTPAGLARSVQAGLTRAANTACGCLNVHGDCMGSGRSCSQAGAPRPCSAVAVVLPGLDEQLVVCVHTMQAASLVTKQGASTLDLHPSGCSASSAAACAYIPTQFDSQAHAGAHQHAIPLSLAAGKYGEVYEVIDLRSDSRKVVKIMRPVKEHRLRREIKILRHLQVGDIGVCIGVCTLRKA
jgi:hypothetical protein